MEPPLCKFMVKGKKMLTYLKKGRELTEQLPEGVNVTLYNEIPFQINKMGYVLLYKITNTFLLYLKLRRECFGEFDT